MISLWDGIGVLAASSGDGAERRAFIEPVERNKISSSSTRRSRRGAPPNLSTSSWPARALSFLAISSRGLMRMMMCSSSSLRTATKAGQSTKASGKGVPTHLQKMVLSISVGCLSAQSSCAMKMETPGGCAASRTVSEVREGGSTSTHHFSRPAL